MSTVARALVTLSAAIILASGARADVIHVPSEVPTIGQALDMAADGDVVLLAPGNYPEAEIAGKAVSLVGDGTAHLTALMVCNLPAGAVVLLQNLSLGPAGFGSGIPALVCRDSAGSILIRNCSGLGAAGASVGFALIADGATGLRIRDCGDVAAIDCTFTGGAGATLDDEVHQFLATSGGRGVDVRGTNVALFGVTATGGSGGSVDDSVSVSAGSGGVGLLNDAAVVHASGCTFRGGHGGFGNCTLTIPPECGSGGSGGDGILQLSAAAALSVRANQYYPRGGGFGGDGTRAPGGVNRDISAGSLLEFRAPYRSIALTSPVREGQVATLTITGRPGDVAFVHLGLQPHWPLKPILQGVDLLDSPVLTLYLGSLSSSQLSIASTVAELGPGVLDIPVHLQLIIRDATGFSLGPAIQQLLLDGAE